MIAERSPSVNRPFGVNRVMRLLERSRLSLYWARARRAVIPGPGHKRGPKTAYTDAELTEKIRAVLGVTPFVGEGHRKVWARLHNQGVRTSKQRTMRFMCEAGLLAPGRAWRTLGPRVHDGTITAEKPNVMWGTDATSVWTERKGTVTVFAVIDHATAECLGVLATKYRTRYEAPERIRQGVRRIFGRYGPDVASGMQLRNDQGGRLVRAPFKSEITFLGIESNLAFVRPPDGNSCIEPFFRALKEQLLCVRSFADAEDVRRTVLEWITLYNEK